MLKRTLFLLTCIICGFQVKAQDSIKVFSCEDFFDLVLKNHPIAQQASLLTESARQEIRTIRGAFDPKINSDLSQKQFQSKEYYTLWDSYLKIPTWAGIDIKAGYEKNTGGFVSNEHVTPSQGLAYLGLSLPIGQGLIIDERRSQLRQAQQLPVIAEAERIKVINKLLLQAAKDYWDWMFYYNKLVLYRKGYTMASTRYEAVKERAKLGDLASIDTVEAAMQMQSFQIMLALSELEYQNSSLILSNYLWTEDGQPLEITGKIKPSEEFPPSGLSAETIESLIQRAKTSHPDILKLRAKINQLDVERRYRADKFKPKVLLEYNILQTGFPVNGEALNSSYLSNNYKFGASLSYPLFLRYERGKYQLTKLKIQDAGYELKQTNREIENNIQASANEWLATEKQVRFQESFVKNAEALRVGEQMRFENGESSVFLINARETALISSQVKLYEMRAKYAKSRVMLEWAAGAVNQ
ncbi:MAG: TolC family protein [Cytophagaceae bacterium]|nr:TolC family protein [Cytophagaceae bacterium]